ncbi:MAG: hypothetical protein WCF85_14660 [Rhodospirillaceae bacterium]
MLPDLTDVSERVAALEARFTELALAFHEQVQRQERHQEVMLKEIGDIKQFLHTAKAVGRITIWCGGAVLALISGLPTLIQWLHDHFVFKP